MIRVSVGWAVPSLSARRLIVSGPVLERREDARHPARKLAAGVPPEQPPEPAVSLREQPGHLGDDLLSAISRQTHAPYYALSRRMSRSHRPSLTFAALGIAAAAYAVSQTMLIPSLPDLEVSLHTSPVRRERVDDDRSGSPAPSRPVVFGRLGDMYGKRRLIVVTVLSFSLGGVLCALASSLAVMIAGRVLMGCGVGIFPLAYSLIRDEFEPRASRAVDRVPRRYRGDGGAVGQSTGGFVAERLRHLVDLLDQRRPGPRRR